MTDRNDFAGSEINEDEMGTKRMEILMKDNLSGSQLDLVMHGEGDPIAPGHCKPHQYDNDLSKAFLESERGKPPNTEIIITHGENNNQTTPL